MSKPEKVEEQLREVIAGLKSGKQPAWMGTLTTMSLAPILTDAAAEIDRLKGLGAELEQMRQLNGRLLRRLAGD
jgi:hypothetical protein